LTSSARLQRKAFFEGLRFEKSAMKKKPFFFQSEAFLQLSLLQSKSDRRQGWSRSRAKPTGFDTVGFESTPCPCFLSLCA
jgi:hypothetical protein